MGTKNKNSNKKFLLTGCLSLINNQKINIDKKKINREKINAIDLALIEAQKIVLERLYIPESLRNEIKVVKTENNVKLVKMSKFDKSANCPADYYFSQEILAKNKKEAVKKSKKFIGELMKHYPLTTPKDKNGEGFHKIEVSLCVMKKIWKGSIEAMDLPTTPSQDKIIKIKNSENKFF